VAALVRSRYPDLPADEVVRRIEATAVSPTGGRDERTGAGIVDPYLAVTAEIATPRQVGDAPAQGVQVASVPAVPPLLTPGEATAGGVAAVLLGCAAVAVGAGLTARRITARRGRDGPAYRPVDPVPTDRLS
jgi:membrane-anchored mycosin MYCP